MAGNGFPGAVWIPAHPDRYTVKTSRQIDAIVLHATDGSAVDARVTAKNVFGSPKSGTHRMAYGINNRRITLSAGTEPSSNACSTRTSLGTRTLRA